MENIQFTRHRRLRKNEAMRSLVRETTLQKEDLIYPIFIIDGEKVKNEIASMPGIYQLSLDNLLSEVEESIALGIKAFILFGVPFEHDKDECGTGAFSHNGLVQKATRLIKEKYPEVLIVADGTKLHQQPVPLTAHGKPVVRFTFCIMHASRMPLFATPLQLHRKLLCHCVRNHFCRKQCIQCGKIDLFIFLVCFRTDHYQL